MSEDALEAAKTKLAEEFLDDYGLQLSGPEFNRYLKRHSELTAFEERQQKYNNLPYRSLSIKSILLAAALIGICLLVRNLL